MTGKLTTEQQLQLEKWIGTGPKAFSLLYSADVHGGCNATTFHQRCDNQGPTVTVLYNQHGSVYGGYTSVSWISSGGQNVSDDKAFLFQLAYSGSSKFTKFDVKSPSYAIYCQSDYGPSFGAASDLASFTNTVNKYSGYYSLNGTMSFSYYNNQGKQPSGIHNGSLTVTDLEVYKVADCARKTDVVTDVSATQVDLCKKWRYIKDLDKESLCRLLEELEIFRPLKGSGITYYRILLLGPVGAGKSSFFNTVNSVFRGRITHRALCGHFDHSVTTTMTPYTVRSKSGETLNFRICDTRGFEESQGPDALDLSYLLDGHMPDYYVFNPSTHIGAQNSDFVLKPKLRNKVHCGVIVLDALSRPKTDKMLLKLKSIQSLFTEKEIPYVIMLTKLDKVSPAVAEDARNVFSCEKIKTIVDDVSKQFGLPRNVILPVVNYEENFELDESISVVALLALKQMLFLAEDYTENLIQKMNATLSLDDSQEMPDNDERDEQVVWSTEHEQEACSETA